MDPQLPPKPQPLPPPEPGRPTANDPLAITSLALGATSLFFAGCCFPLSLVVGPLAIIFGIVALTRIASSGQQGKGLAVAGIVTGILGPVLGVSLFLLGVLGGTGATFVSGLFE